MTFKKIYRIIYRKTIGKFNPVKYAVKIGVNMRGTVHIYGNVGWSTEPWIITLGNEVHITDGVKFLTHDGGTLLYRNKIPDLEITKPITVGNDVYIGNNVIIGAGAIVSKDIPDNSVAVGVPARVIKTADDYLEKIKKESLHLGNFKGEEKDKKLKEYYGYKGNSKGIYF